MTYNTWLTPADNVQATFMNTWYRIPEVVVAAEYCTVRCGGVA